MRRHGRRSERDGPLPAVLLGVCVVLLGCLSAWLGQDASFDLRNYHYYNAWALFEGGRPGDLAPAQVQSFFNPLLDVPYYWLSLHLPARWLAFVMGLWPGLIVFPLYALGRLVAPRGWALAVAAFGCLAPTFLYQIGGVMGDGVTAVFNLLALFLLLSRWDEMAAGQRSGTLACLMAGVLAGAAVGLKLTNGPFALALGLMPLLAQAPWPQRLRLLLAFGLGGALGLVATAGWWWLQMWQRHGNPLHPLLGSVFGSDAGSQITVMDPRWGPHAVVEALTWPLQCVLMPWRWGEIRMLPLTLALAYGLLVWQACAWLLRKLGRRATAVAAVSTKPAVAADVAAGGRETALLAWAVLSYVLWLKVFAIGRYVLTIELLAPLLALLLWRRCFGARRGQRLLAGLLVLFGLIAVLDLNTWDKAGLRDPAFEVRGLEFPEPGKTVVVYVGWDAQAWMSTRLGPATAYAGIGNFPHESAAWRRLLGDLLASREHRYAVFPATPFRASRAPLPFDAQAVQARLIEASGAFAGDDACRSAARWAGRLSSIKRNFQGRVVTTASGTAVCRLSVEESAQAAAERDGRPAVVAAAAQTLAGYGLKFDPPACTRHDATIGSAHFPFLMCPIAAVGAGTTLAPRSP